MNSGDLTMTRIEVDMILAMAVFLFVEIPRFFNN